MLNDLPREKLRFIIEEYGRSAIRDANRCRELLREHAPENLRETNLLMLVLTEGFVSELTAENLESVAQRLHEKFGIQQEFTFWAVKSWALALHLLQISFNQKDIDVIFELENKKIEPQKLGEFIIENGMVTDTKTGLMWLRFSYGQTWKNGKVFGDAEIFNWNDAMKIPTLLNRGEGYMGFDNWRIPDRIELKNLAKKNTDNITFTTSECFNKLNTHYIFPRKKESFWSSSQYAFDRVFAVNFQICKDDFYSPQKKFEVLLVRNTVVTQIVDKAEIIPIPRKIGKFIVEDGIATDTETSLMWLRFAYGQKWNNGKILGISRKLTCWDEVIKAVQQFNEQDGYKGYSNWRIPSVEELKELFEGIKTTVLPIPLSGKGHIADYDIFPEIDSYFWAKDKELDSPFAYIVDSESGEKDFILKSAIKQLFIPVVRLVRDSSLKTKFPETETTLEVMAAKVETEKTTITVPLLKDEATQDFEDMF
jgi:hypothetical protein